MAFSSQEKMRLMTKVSIMYYIDGMNQQEIADKLGISRPQISRMITNARAEGIVDITVKDAFAQERIYEQWLCREFGLLNAVVVDAPEEDLITTPRMIARSACEMIEASVRNDDVIGVGAGNTVGMISEELRSLPRKSVSFVPLMGGISSNGTNWQANFNARRCAENCGAYSWQFNVPMVVGEETYQALSREPEIVDVWNRARGCTLALIGIGQFSRDATILKTGFLGAEDIEELREKKAVASVCCSFLDARGQEIEFRAGKRMFGLTVADLKKVPRVITVAWGEEKLQAIESALRGGWMHTFITTFATVKALHDNLGNPPLE